MYEVENKERRKSSYYVMHMHCRFSKRKVVFARGVGEKLWHNIEAKIEINQRWFFSRYFQRKRIRSKRTTKENDAKCVAELEMRRLL